MKKKSIVNSIIAFMLLFSLQGCSSAEANLSKSVDQKSAESASEKQNASTSSKTVSTSTPAPTPAPTPTPAPMPKPVPTCDGTTITSGCQVDGITYSTYIYHPAVAEKSHIETSTTTEQVVADYCTLCVDGSWSPTCATGKGACSHHGGVSQKNVARYKDETHTTQAKVVDSPAVDAYYEKVVQQ